MLELFQAHFKPDNARLSQLEHSNTLIDHRLVEFIGQFGGMTFAGGLYRVIAATALSEWDARVAHAFPDYTGRISCFGYDWMGRAFALDTVKSEGGASGVLLFEPGSADVFEIPHDLAGFHDKELIGSPDVALESGFYQEWLGGGGARPCPSECVGYIKPLFLSGEHEVTNLEIADLDVYWHVLGQLIVRTRGLAEGARVHMPHGD